MKVKIVCYDSKSQIIFCVISTKNNQYFLLKIPSLKLVYYTAKNEEQEKILRRLSEKGVEVIQNNEERYVNIFDEMEKLGIEYVDYKKLQ